MSNKIFVVKTDPDKIIRMPERSGKILPDEGAYVPENKYWLARIYDGDVKTIEVPVSPDKIEENVEVVEPIKRQIANTDKKAISLNKVPDVGQNRNN